MIGQKEWLIKLGSSNKTGVKLANNTYLAAEGICDIIIKRKDERNALIVKVLFVLGLKCNLLSIE